MNSQTKILLIQYQQNVLYNQYNSLEKTGTNILPMITDHKITNHLGK